MASITVTVDDETHRLVRERATELDTSVPEMVCGYLADVADECRKPARNDEEFELYLDELMALFRSVGDRADAGSEVTEESLEQFRQQKSELDSRYPGVVGKPHPPVVSAEESERLRKQMHQFINERRVALAELSDSDDLPREPFVLTREELYDRARARVEEAAARDLDRA